MSQQSRKPEDGTPRVTAGGAVTAGDLAVADVLVAAPETSAGKILETLRRADPAIVDPVVVCADRMVLGTIPLRRVIRTSPDTPAMSLMEGPPTVVAASLGQEQAALTAVQASGEAVAVVDDDGRFLGLLPAVSLLPVLVREHEEDLARVSGLLRGTSVARATSEEPVPRRLMHRLPWLIVGLVGAFVSADLVGLYEAELRRRVILAFFLPGVVYLADAVGTQTETIVIRSMAVGVPLKNVLRREWLTGILAGLSLALLFMPIALLRWNDFDVALAVAISLLAACSIASVIAMTLPWIFLRLGSDPAFGSGPLATVMQDLLSIITYLIITSLIV